jgi:septal ring factor EnvC (AmiA/AmiB activator)
VKTAAAFLTLMMTTTTTVPPALVTVDKSCARYADTHVLVRTDVWDRVDASDRKLGICEPSLEQAQEDIRALRVSIEEHARALETLRSQKRVLDSHVSALEALIQRHVDYIKQLEASKPGTSDWGQSLIEAWEWVDAPVALVAGVGMCLGAVMVVDQLRR